MLSDGIVLVSLAAAALGSALCKNHPSSNFWPIDSDWKLLNQSTQGALLAGVAPASSCYEGNPLNSSFECEGVQENWFLSEFHVYVLNATHADQIATAAEWATSHDVRLVIKGTGHDLNGRSSGAFALSIWTRHLDRIKFDTTENAVIAQSGNTWGRLLNSARAVNRTVISGQDSTVGLGGFIGGSGNGPLSSTYGLSADQILQATLVTTDGRVVVANDAQNQDLLWAIRGGGPGLYGVVVEYVMRTFPLPENVVIGSLSLSTQKNRTEDASWNGLSAMMRALPDLMDLGVTGFGIATVSQSRVSSQFAPRRQVNISMTFYIFNSTTNQWLSLLKPLKEQTASLTNKQFVQVELSEPRVLPYCLDLFSVLNPMPSQCGDISLSSSRLLGRRELTDMDHDTVKNYLKRVTVAQVEGKDTRSIVGLQGGLGPRNVEHSMRGGVTPAWRDAYLHVLSTGSHIEEKGVNAHSTLQAAADWTNNYKESVWSEWAPDSGSYINEANPFNPNFQHDFYGGHYDRLLGIKRRYDPRSTLYVQAGVGSHDWEYILQNGKLCKKY